MLVAGKTGSGKSTLLHVLITNLALRYSPDEIELYLIDFKKGVEFKTYATFALPHARVVAIESDREFGLSVLQRLDAELKVRGEMFRDSGAQDVASYRRVTGESLPRILLIIDEFQEFFVEDDKIAQDVGAAVRPAWCGKAVRSASTCCWARRRWAAPIRWPAARSGRWPCASPCSAARPTRI